MGRESGFQEIAIPENYEKRSGSYKQEIKIMALTDNLKEYANTLGVDFIGFCSTNSFNDAPEDGKPDLYLKNALSMISVGYRLNYSSLQNLPQSRSAYMLEYDYGNRQVDQASHRIARFLEERGFDAIGFDASAGFHQKTGRSIERLFADFSHKHAAVASGLGKFGLNNLILSPQWGPRLRLSTIITCAPLEYAPPNTENPCLANTCRKCVDICPVHALDGWENHHNPVRGWAMDKKKCFEYMFKTLEGQRCGLCIKACPVGSMVSGSKKNRDSK
jgi:epoxyqueuosine reductase